MNYQANLAVSKKQGSVIGGMFIMLIVSVLLFWLPVIGPLLAGIAGGKKAGSVSAAILAFFLPGIILGILLFFMSGAFVGLPLIGFVAGTGAFVLTVVHSGPMLIGAVIGGILA